MHEGVSRRERSAKHRLRVAAGALAGLSESGDADEAIVWVDGDEAHHASRVLRLGAGDAVGLLDGRGMRVAAEVVSVASGRVGCRVVGEAERVARPRPRVTVLAPAAKGSRGDEIADRLAQVGADRWVVLETARSVVEPGAGKLGKWRRRSEEASKQCGRAWDMAVEGPVGFDEAVAWASASGVSAWLMDVDGESSAAPSVGASAEELMVMVGPEGGWTDEERSAARSAGWRAWTVGRYVMRLETAAVVGAAMLAAGVHSTHG
ncbi:MAG: RsmE family RNA methyltransferase [Planctomycetota bacterium]